MIIRCPECSTGFNLPDERVTSDGTKLKCSRCEHVFRVREDDAGEIEIFYRSHDNKEKAAAAAGGGGDNSFPDAGLGLKPKTSGAFGDSSGDDEPDVEDDKASELQHVVEEPGDSDSEPGASDSEPGVSETESGVSETESGASETESGASDSEPGDEGEESTSDPMMGSESTFGDPEEHVDPSFGESGPVFDPDQGKVTKDVEDDATKKSSAATKTSGPKGPPGASAGPPPSAAGAPPTQRAGGSAEAKGGPAPAPTQTSSVESAGQAAKASPPDQWDDEALEPHNIGGSTRNKVVTVLFLLLLVGGGFIATVATLNDGFIDFHAFDDMLEVAFSDGEYEPRDEWVHDTPDVTVVEEPDSVEVRGVFGEVVTVGQGDEILVLQGMARNNEDSRLHRVDLRGLIVNEEGRSIHDGDVVSPIGEDDAPIGEFRGLDSIDDIDELLDETPAMIEVGETRPFTLVFEEVPQTVLDGERFSVRVDVADVENGG